MKFEFCKIHGCGNSFVCIDDRANSIKNPRKLAAHICNVKFGIGADGLILVRRSRSQDFRMDYFNSDGSIAEMCGNGIRCLTKFVRDYKISSARELAIETRAGTILTHIAKNSTSHTAWVRVDMGMPMYHDGEKVYRQSKIDDVKIGKRNYLPISMGNPHAVTFVKGFNFDVVKEGTFVENYTKIFPKKVNVGFAQIKGNHAIRLRVWERGCGLTLACGTGACAAVVAATLHKKIKDGVVRVVVDGGTLEIDWNRNNNHVYMTGPAETIARGTLEL